jgi:hypothetical protein
MDRIQLPQQPPVKLNSRDIDIIELLRFRRRLVQLRKKTGLKSTLHSLHEIKLKIVNRYLEFPRIWHTSDI